MDSKHAFNKIPIVDLAHLTKSDASTLHRLAAEVRQACTEVGFFYVANHGIDEGVIARAIETAKAFYALPLEIKMKSAKEKADNFMGYAPLLSGNNDPQNAGDMHEGFEFGWEELDSSQAKPVVDGEKPVGKNVWPSDAPELREAALGYYHAAVTLGKALFPLFALALDLPADFFTDKTTKSAAIMSLLHYPPQTGQIDERVIGIGAHTDWECFTILWQQPEVQALQVLNANKEWINAPPIPGTLVINIGDQLARWTNDVFKSTVHRAINRSGVRRYSIPLFFGTDYDVKLEPLPSCVSPENPAKYPVVTAGEYVKSRFQATYKH